MCTLKQNQRRSQVQMIDSRTLAKELSIEYSKLLKTLSAYRARVRHACKTKAQFDENKPLTVGIEYPTPLNNLVDYTKQVNTVCKQIETYEKQKKDNELAVLPASKLNYIAETLRELWRKAKELQMFDSEITRIETLGKEVTRLAKINQTTPVSAYKTPRLPTKDAFDEGEKQLYGKP